MELFLYINIGVMIASIASLIYLIRHFKSWRQLSKKLRYPSYQRTEDIDDFTDDGVTYVQYILYPNIGVYTPGMDVARDDFKPKKIMMNHSFDKSMLAGHDWVPRTRHVPIHPGPGVRETPTSFRVREYNRRTNPLFLE